MLILSWNAQGLGRPLTFQVLQGLYRAHRPGVVFLMETKNNSNKLESIRKRLQFSFSWYVEPQGLSGGLALWWTSEVSISVLSSSKNLIAATLSSSPPSSSWLLTCVYADSIYSNRSLMWDDLQSLGSSFNGPWLCIGDFNEVSSIWEKQGGREINSNRLERFNNFVSDSGLIDLEFKGINYTWTNKREGDDNIRERIDKALANTLWRLKFPNAQVFHEPIVGSDHAPLVLNCCVPLKRVKRVFRFESMWTTSPNCQDVIANSWTSDIDGSNMFVWCKKLKFCRKALKLWSKNEFGNNRIRLAKLKQQLYDLQLANPSPDNTKAQKCVIQEMEEAYSREEMEDGVWCTSEDEINGCIAEYFSNLFQDQGNREMDQVLGAIDSCITPDMNAKLLSPILPEEIKRAAFQMGALKAPGPDGFPGSIEKEEPAIRDRSCRAAKKGGVKQTLLPIVMGTNGKGDFVGLKGWVN
ncbi:hypothetical protein Vadar_024028 [Vaccinium darrowii]|uniref:Uncharacterized protein n=1 Tax=Vaccinium darrowii TaxID=229202 RepID=A0ACB7XJL2_9ERIC|nr:hypothetical protein Vadar_024028 [Vaccinium darrowii]